MPSAVNLRTALLVGLVATSVVLATVLVIGVVTPSAVLSSSPSSANPPPVVNTTVCAPTTNPPGGDVLGQICVGDWPQYVLVDPANGMVYVSAEYSNNVSVVNAATFQKTATVSASNARGLAIDPATGRLFVSDGFGDGVTVVNTANNAILTTVNMTGYGYMVSEQYDSYTGQVYVLANNNPDLLALNPSTYAITKVIPIDPNPGGTAYAILPSTHVIYFPARGMDSVALIGELNGTSFAHIAMPGLYGPTSTFYDPTNGLVYVMLGGLLDSPGNQMVVLDPATGSILTTLTLGEWPNAYAYDPATQLLFVSCAASGSISVINTTTNQLVSTIDLGNATLPGGIAVDPTTGNLFVGEDGTGELVEVSTLSLQPPPPVLTCISSTGDAAYSVLGCINIGDWPQYVLVDPANGMIYASAEYSNNVSVVNAATFQKTDTLSASNARGLAIDPATGRLFVSDGFGDGVNVFATSNDAYLTTVNMTGYSYMVGEQYDPYTGLIYVLANNNPDLLALNPSTYAVTSVMPIDPNPGGGSGYAIVPSTHVIYFPARGMYSVALIGELNGTTFAYIAMPGSYGPVSTFYDPVNGLVYVMLGGWMYTGPGDQMVVLNPATGNIVATLTLGYFPASFAYDPVTQLLFVSCADSGTVSVVNASTNQLVATINLGAGSEPGGIAVDPSTGHLFVGLDGTGELVELS